MGNRSIGCWRPRRRYQKAKAKGRTADRLHHSKPPDAPAAMASEQVGARRAVEDGDGHGEDHQHQEAAERARQTDTPPRAGDRDGASRGDSLAPVAPSFDGGYRVYGGRTRSHVRA
ncbi:hypothetical protein SCMU_05990 [Sinomonas cyclohexanicum]|uniref:Uncharacterized protein n=1 Tax=Sinomonas cyclohexanicum TaxID=322009 RepID=A0ABM7PRD0_SINCY|nr:hypothetical protein SCMU_05990 [Corynebacterium cyclohexanicum]